MSAVKVHYYLIILKAVLVLMKMYSYSGLSNALVLTLTHKQCTRTRTHDNVLRSMSASEYVVIKR